MSSESNTESIDTSVSGEQGGPHARLGFGYQDEIATALFLEMVENENIHSLQCETADDIVLVYQYSSRRIAEFIQVKSGNYAPASVYDICSKRQAPNSIVERSLSLDKVAEEVRFRIISSKEPTSDLICLKEPHETRREDDKRFRTLTEALEAKLPHAMSPNRNGVNYWCRNCLWDTRARLPDLRNANYVKLAELFSNRKIPLDADSIGNLLNGIRNIVRVAAEHLQAQGIKEKTIVRSEAAKWLNDRSRELVSIAQLLSRADDLHRIRPVAAEIARSVENAKEPVDRKAFHYLKRSLRWNYIAEYADSPRSLYSSVLPELLQTGSGPRLFCLVGEPLSGKSTLLWRLAYDLHLQGKNVFQVLNADKHLWSKLGVLVGQSDQHFFLLVDDIFEDKDSVKAVRNFFEEASNSNTSVTIIASSVSDNLAAGVLSDLRRMGLQVWSEPLVLTKLDKANFQKASSYDAVASTTFKSDSLERIDKLHTLAATLREYEEGGLNDTNISSGFVAEALEASRLERLRLQQPKLWSAYKYVAFCYRMRIVLPLSILQKVEDFRFYDIATLDGAESYLTFHDKFVGGLSVASLNYPAVSSQHWKLADTHWRIYRQFESTAAVLRQILTCVDPQDDWEGGFLTHLCWTIVNDSSVPLRHLIPSHHINLSAVKEKLSIEQLLMWKRIYSKFGMLDEAMQCAQFARDKQPSDATDAIAQLSIFEKEDRDIRRVFDAIAGFRQRWPNNINIDEYYISFIARHKEKFAVEVQAILSQMGDILREAGENLNIVAVFLTNVLIPCGSPIHHLDAALKIGDWLEKNPDHPSAAGLWVMYLALVQRTLPLKLQEVCERCLGWLSSHRTSSGYVHVANPYGANMAKSEDEVAMTAAFLELQGWLAVHPLNSHVWECCLKIACNCILKIELVESMLTMLAGSPEAEASGSELIFRIQGAGVACGFVDVIKSRFQSEVMVNFRFAFGRVSKWLEIYPEDYHARKHFISYVRDHGTSMHRKAVIRETARWLEGRDEDKGVRNVYETLVARQIAEP